MWVLWKNTPSTYTFFESLIVIEYSHIFQIFLKVNVTVILKEIPRNTALLKLVCFRAWIIRVVINVRNGFSHIIFKNGGSDFPEVVWIFFFYTLLKFDIYKGDVSFYKRGLNFETEVKLNKARHCFLKVSQNMPADFQPIPSDNVSERTKNVHPYMQFNFIKKKMKNLLRDWYD